MPDPATPPATTPPAAPPPATPPATTPPTPAWYEGKADAETLGHWQNKGWKTDDPVNIAIEATKAARELQKHFGVPADQLLKLPKPDDEAAWKSVHQRLGMPAEAKDYDFSAVKFADGTDLEDTFVSTMRDALHKAHVPKDAAPDVVKAVVKYLGDADAAEAAERGATLKTERDTLAKDWGKDFEFNRLTAMQGARRLGVDQETVAKIENLVGYAKIMEMFRKVGAGTTEDTFVSSQPGGHVTTANGAAARLEELGNDKAFVAKYLAGDIAARREMDNLQLLKNGGQAA